MKETYGARLGADPNGAPVFVSTLADFTGVAVGALVVSGVGVGLNLLTGLLADAIFVGTEIAVGSLTTIATLGPLAILAVMLIVGITAGVQAVERQKNQDDLEEMTTLRTKAYAAPPDITSFMSDPTGVLQAHGGVRGGDAA